jgi:hypothetical protein
MSKTLIVRELITNLLRYEMDAEVFIGLGPSSIPARNSTILNVCEYNSGITCDFGVYINPSKHLEEGA